jgi:hypothetical protein
MPMPARVVAAILGLGVGASGAAADGPSGLVRIAHGTSAGGQAWTQKARADHGDLLVEIVVPINGQDEGAIEHGPPTSHWPMFVGRGSDLGTAQDEYELDGSTLATVPGLLVTTVRRTLVIHPRRAPVAALRRWPQLARYRFFFRFFAADDRPVRISALDGHGHVLVSEPGVRG